MEDTENILPKDIPGQIISILTFPGIIIHTLAYAIFCKLTRVHIYDIRVFHPLKNPPNYVRHDKPRYFISTLLIVAGPLLMSTLLAVGIFSVAIILQLKSYLLFTFLWLGIATGMHAFPSTGEAGELLDETNERVKDNILFVLAYPIVVMIYIADFLSMIWFDAFYALGLLFLSSYLTGISIWQLV